MKQFMAISLFCASSILLSACGSSSGDANNTVNNNPTKSKIHLSITDAHAGYVSGKMKLLFKGMAVVNSNNEEITELIIEGDQAENIILSPKDMPSSIDNLIILAEAQGYNDSGTSVIITPQTIDQEVRLKLTKDKEGKITDGIYARRADISAFFDKNGVVVSEIVVNSKADANSPGVKVTIPVGTTMQDKEGNPITSGTLKVVAFDPSKAKALAAYPISLHTSVNTL